MVSPESAAEPAVATPKIRPVGLEDPWSWLAAGWRDLWRRPGIGLGYGASVTLFSILLFELAEKGFEPVWNSFFQRLVKNPLQVLFDHSIGVHLICVFHQFTFETGPICTKISARFGTKRGDKGFSSQDQKKKDYSDE